MSASPSGLSNGQTPTPNGGPPQFIRKPKPADPLRPRKKLPRRPNLPPGASAAKPNGLMPNTRPPGQAPPNGSGPARGPPRPIPANGAHPQQTYGGWTNPPPPNKEEYTDYDLFTTKRAMREGLRYHIARFNGKKDVDPSNQDEFTRPVVLHRRDPRVLVGKDGKEEEVVGDETMDSKEREKAEIAKAEKDARRAADLAQIAPTGNNALAAGKKAQFVKGRPKTEQVYRTDKTAEDKKKSDLRYEEALPWHLEDADGKNAWFGNYEAALSDINVIFVVEGQHFKMIPAEKWYKFTQKAQFKTYTIEEAESRLSKGAKETRWSMQAQEKKKAEREAQESRNLMRYGNRPLFAVKGESVSFKNSSKRETEDADEMDFEADDLFQDDDEQATVEPDQDEEVKEAQGRIKREQLGANIFDLAVEAEVDKELAREKKEEESRKLLGKGVTKALKKREKNYIYESDKSSNPFESSSSDDDTSDEEKQAEIDKRKDEEAKAKAKMDARLPSGASSKGTNTPSGRPKHSDPLKKGKSLKRPGSPNLSESSGNESSRKKHKKKHASSQPTEIQSAPPNPSPIHSSAMSDGEATGGEMSDGAKKRQKIKLRVGGTATPTGSGSRAGSPAPGRAASLGAGGSRAGSPAAQAQATAGASRSQSPPRGSGPIQPYEIAAALPAEGITIGALMKLFSGRVGDIEGQQTNKAEFIRLVKDNSSYSADKLLRPK